MNVPPRRMRHTPVNTGDSARSLKKNHVVGPERGWSVGQVDPAQQRCTRNLHGIEVGTKVLNSCWETAKGETYGLAAVSMDFGRGSRKPRLSGHTGGSG